METGLVKYEEACRAVAEAKTTFAANAVRNDAEAMRAYAKQAKNKEMEVDAAEIRLLAERKLGELINAQKETVGLATGGEHGGKAALDGTRSEPSNPRPTLADAGIDKKLSSKAQKLAALPEDKFNEALGEWREQVEKKNERVTTNLLKSTARQSPKVSDAPFPEGKYGVIYADPPWGFEVWSGEGKDRAAENHYPTMTQKEIEGLPVADLAGDNCALFLWAVMPQLPEALRVINAWGFKFKTCAFVWVKTTKDGERFATGMGYWTRANAEICLLATKGSPERLNADVKQVISTPRTQHSQKPDEAIERVERLVGGPYLELFARRCREGWSAWGNQLDGSL